MVNVWRQEQPVGAVQAFNVRCVTPRLDVAGLQVSGLSDARHATRVFPQKNVGPKHTLTSPGSDKLLSEGRSGDAGIANHVEFDRLWRLLEGSNCLIGVPVVVGPSVRPVRRRAPAGPPRGRPTGDRRRSTGEVSTSMAEKDGGCRYGLSVESGSPRRSNRPERTSPPETSLSRRSRSLALGRSVSDLLRLQSP